MLISAVLITSLFIIVMILVVRDKINRAFLALIGAALTYCILVYIETETYDISTLMTLLWGSPEDDFVEFHSLLLILSMMIIVEISRQTGVFQFLAFRLIQLTKGHPKRLLVTLCSLAVFLTAILNNLLTVIVLIPLTFTVARILNVDPLPYVLSETYFVTIGGTILPISSIPGILISFEAGLSFGDFFINIGLISILIYLLTLGLFLAVFWDKLEDPTEGITILLEYNVWAFVENRKLMLKSLIALICVIIGFVLIPSDIMTPDLIALFGALALTLSDKIDAKKVLEGIDIELLLFLMGISVIVGALDLVGVISVLGEGLENLSGGNFFLTILVVLFSSAFLSAAVDDISISKVMIPVVKYLTQGLTTQQSRFMYYSLNWGINFGDNMTPFGDTIMVLNMAEQNNHPITFKMYVKYGMMTAFFNLAIITIYISFYFYVLFAIALTLGLIGILIAVFYPRIKKRRNIKSTSEIRPSSNREKNLNTTIRSDFDDSTDTTDRIESRDTPYSID